MTNFKSTFEPFSEQIININPTNQSNNNASNQKNLEIQKFILHL